MRIARIAALAVLVSISGAGPMPGQSVDLSGTWTGSAEVPNSPNPNLITLVLKKDGDTYTGTLSDSMGMVNEAVLQKVKFEDNTLTFELAALVGEQTIMVTTTLKYTEEKLVGSWMTFDGNVGSLEMKRKK